VALEDPDASERLRHLCTNSLAVNERHERLIDGLLTLASSEQRVADPTQVDLADVARFLVSESEGAAQGADVDIRVRLASAPVSGDPVLLERLAQNLIDNAIRYSLPRGGWMSVTTEVVDGTVRLTVENSGPHVPHYEVPSLFQPFRRLAATSVVATAPLCRTAAEPASACRSCSPSPRHMAARSMRRLGRMAASR
jgi:signal transduction histidine kinase